MIKFIVSDMDGTLFAGHGETVFDLSQRNQEAMKRVQEAGIQFCVASGRMIGYGVNLLKRYGFPIIRAAGFNGAVCYDQGELVSVLPVDYELLRVLVPTVEREFPDVRFLQIQGLGSERIFSTLDHPRVEKYRQEIAQVGIAKIADFTIHEFLEDPRGVLPGKFSITMDSREACEKVMARAREIVGESCFVTLSGDTLIEIGNRQAGKGVFVRYLKEAYHLAPAEIAVIGDALNDAEMYPESGLTFAMASGDPAVQEMADMVVDDVAQCIDECIRRNQEERNTI